MKAFIIKLSTIFHKLATKVKWVVLVAVVLTVGYLIGKQAQPPQTGHTQIPAAVAETKVKLWTCSMHPEIRLPKPGLCPKCGMKLIPLVTEETETPGSMRQLVVSDSAKELMDIEVAPVERRFVTATVRMVGKVDYDETRLAYITSWIPGRLDRLYVDYTGVPVRKGDHMVSLYSPELITAQQELIQAVEAIKNIAKSELGVMREMTRATAQAARDKLLLWGLTAEQVAEIEKTGHVSDHMTIYAPASGIVIHKNALEGMYVQTGTRIYTIADLSKVWVKLDAYESDLEWLRYGQAVEFTTVSYPGRLFKGTISFIDPILNERTRTVKIRINVSNTDSMLKPGMFVKAAVHSRVAAGGEIMDPNLAGKWICPMHPSVVKDKPGNCDICQMPLVKTETLGYVSSDPALAKKPLVIPVSAALVTGTRAIVYVQVPDAEKPTFEGRQIVLGPRAGDYYLVRRGLSEGELVVVRGNFKIDSSLQIMAKPSMMTPQGGASGQMHHHGSMAMPQKNQAESAGQLSAVSKEQIRTVVEKADTAQKAAAGEDITKIRAAFSDLAQAINGVDMKLMTGHTHMRWMEYKMLLGNDAFEGAGVKTLQDAKRVAGSLAENIIALKKLL